MNNIKQEKEIASSVRSSQLRKSSKIIIIAAAISLVSGRAWDEDMGK
jgi:hypothetical protein